MHAEAAHHFSPQANDWGFTAFATQQEIYQRGAGFLVDDTLQMCVVVKVDRPEDLHYDSKKSTGYVGLKNQGATCYMNSLLQTLYNINYFRQVHVITCHLTSRSSCNSDMLCSLCLLVLSATLAATVSHVEASTLQLLQLKFVLSLMSTRLNPKLFDDHGFVRQQCVEHAAGCLPHAYARGRDAIHQHSTGLAEHLLQGA